MKVSEIPVALNLPVLVYIMAPKAARARRIRADTMSAFDRWNWNYTLVYLVMQDLLL